jgi:hypothetical protein
MRKLFFVLLPAVVICGLWGCQKAASLGNAASGSGGQDSGSFTVTIDGKPWLAIDSARSVSIMNGAINISGLSSDDQNIVLSLAGTGTGTAGRGQPDRCRQPDYIRDLPNASV